jgi:xanthine dehydrogenase accessory factor
VVKQILGDIERWRSLGRRLALARVVDVEGSAPREPGAAMAVCEDGEVAGSVSGGCVEGAVVTEALEVLAAGVPRLCTFRYSDDEAFAVGLTCGGTVHVFVEPLERSGGTVGSMFDTVRDHLRAGEPVALATVVQLSGGDAQNSAARSGRVTVSGATLLVRLEGSPLGSLGDPGLDDAVVRDALGSLDDGATGVHRYGWRGEPHQQDLVVFIEAFPPPPRLLIFGAVDFAAALARVAKVLGYRVTVCDARAVFATPSRFLMADEVVVEWPDRHLARVGGALGPHDAICVLTHDPKFDVPAIEAALRTAVGYIGAMGSRRTTAEREKRLRDAGLDDAKIARVMAPIGLDIAARTLEETAVSICAEIIAVRNGRQTSASLSRTDGPIHQRPSSNASCDDGECSDQARRW